MNTIIAGKSGMFGTMRERKRQRRTAPYAVYEIEGGLYWYSGCETAESAVLHGKARATYKSWEFQDRTEEKA